MTLKGLVKDVEKQHKELRETSSLDIQVLLFFRYWIMIIGQSLKSFKGKQDGRRFMMAPN